VRQLRCCCYKRVSETTAGLRQPLLVARTHTAVDARLRPATALCFPRLAHASRSWFVSRQPCNRCVSQPWVRCAHHGRFTKILGSAWIAPNWVGCAHHCRFTKIVESAWIALNWVRCAHRGRFTPTALLWRRRFARAGGPHALHVLFHTVGLRRLLFRGGDGLPAQADHMRCMFCFTRSAYAGRSGSGCTPPASIAHMRTAFGRLTQVATGAGGTGG
jgi:hypothetical protein